MNERKNIKVKLFILITIVLLLILALAAVIILINYNQTNNTQQSSPNEELLKNETTYYEPTEEEKLKADELKSIIGSNLPKMDGSTSTIPLEAGIISYIFDISQEEAEKLVVHSTTYGSFDNLMDEKCDIIFTTPLSETQKETAKSKNIDLEIVPIVYEGFVFVVNASNPVDTLTQQQLKDIYSGKITNWKELGGNDAEIIAYQRNETSGSQNYMTAFMEDTTLMEPVTSFTPASMAGLMDAVATYDNAENAIGYSVYAYAADMYGNGNEIKFIKVDGVEPTKETMASKAYPLLNYNYAVYDKEKEATTTVDELTQWILTYQGQEAMAQAGYIPIKNIKTKEETIQPYTKKGTGDTKPQNYKMPEFSYVVETSSILQNGEITGLKDENLQDEINNFILESKNKLNTQKQFFDNYLNLLNKEYDFTLYTYDNNDPIAVELECINGYLSVQVYLKYIMQVQSSIEYIYDGYSAIFNLITGEKLELSDLYFKNVDFISNINQSIKFFENYESDLGKKYTWKRDFASVPSNINMYSLTTLGFTKTNPYFTEGEIFYLNEYSQNKDKQIYIVNDMKEIWETTVEIEKTSNIFSFEGEWKQQKKDGITYNIATINIDDQTINSKINSYIQNSIENLNNEIKNLNEYQERLSQENIEIIVDIIGFTIGEELARVYIDTNIIDMGDIDFNLMFDLETGELLDTTYEQWIEENNIEY